MVEEKKLDTDGRIRTLELGQVTTQEAILSIRDTLKEFSAALGGIRDSISTIATLETHHNYTRESIGRAFVAIKKIEGEIAGLNKRVTDIEKQIPPLVETRGWIILGMLGVCGIVLTAVVYVAIKVPPL